VLSFARESSTDAPGVQVGHLVVLWAAYRGVRSGVGILRADQAEWTPGIVFSSAMTALFGSVTIGIVLSERQPLAAQLRGLTVTAAAAFSVVVLVLSRRQFDRVP
jgi:hypothetical protein